MGDINGHGEAISRGKYAFLQQVMGKRAKRSYYRKWQQEGAENVLEGTGNQDTRTYIDMRQDTVAQWVAL